MTDYDVTVLICTWNRAARLDETLTSLSSMDVPPGLSWECVVVDNNCTDQTRRVVIERAKDGRFPVRSVLEARQGKSNAMNAGLRASHAPIVAFVDDDVRVDRRWLYALCQAVRSDPSVAYVGGPVDPIWEAPCPAWFAQTGTSLWGTLAILDYGDEPFIFEDRRRIPLGANFALRRTLVDRIGGFDPALGRTSQQLLGQELPEFFARAREMGARGMYVPAMRVAHHVPAARLQPGYLRRWWYGKGISRARLESMHPVTELGLDLRTVPTIGGIPRFLFGSALRDTVRWARAVVTGNRGVRLVSEAQLCYFGGQIRERLRRRAHRGEMRTLPFAS